MTVLPILLQIHYDFDCKQHFEWLIEQNLKRNFWTMSLSEAKCRLWMWCDKAFFSFHLDLKDVDNNTIQIYVVWRKFRQHSFGFRSTPFAKMQNFQFHTKIKWDFLHSKHSYRFCSVWARRISIWCNSKHSAHWLYCISLCTATCSTSFNTHFSATMTFVCIHSDSFIGVCVCVQVSQSPYKFPFAI